MYNKLIENLNDLYYFYVVSKEKSFTNAAKTLFVSQPAVTKRIKNLEKRLNVKLIARCGNRISLTEIGELIFKRLEKIFEEIKKIDQDLSVLKNVKISQTLKIGATPSYSKYLLPKFLETFFKIYPNIKIFLYSESSEQLIKLLLANRIDIAIMAKWKNFNFPGYNIFKFREEEIVLVCGSKNPVNERFIDFEDLKKFKFIMRDNSSGTRKFILHELEKRDIELPIIMEAENSELIKILLKENDYFSFLARTTVENELKSGELKEIHLPEKFKVDILLISRTNISKDIINFIQTLSIF